MLSMETETRVARLFNKLADGEKSIEITRGVLADKRDFDPYLAFKRIDKEGKNFIDEYNIVDFLKQNSVYSTLSDAKFIIFFHDANGDGNLNFSEFLNLVLSENDHYLRRHARDRIGSVYSSHILHPDIEYGISKVFEKELELVRNIDITISDIKTRYDFNVSDIFSLLDLNYFNYLNTEWYKLFNISVRRFMVRNGSDVYESDLKAIFKRLDVNKDGRVSYSEFRQLFEQPANRFSSTSSTLRTSSPMRSLSPLRSQSPLRAQSPLRSTSNYSFKTLSPVRIEKYSSPVRTSGKYYSPRRLYSPRRQQSPLRTSESFSKPLETSSSIYRIDDSVTDYMREMIYLENDLDRTKTDLALRSDFNIEDAFRLFEIDGRGYLTDIDFKYGLNLLEIFPTMEEIKLIFKRYDLNNSGVLNFDNFFDMVSPVDKEFKKTLEIRRPSYLRAPDCFLPTTKFLLQSALKLILSSEVKVEVWRQRLDRTPGFRVKSAFDRLDRIEKGYFHESDLIGFLQRSNITYLNKDIDLLFSRFDKNRDGLVSFLEFNNEIYPASTQIF